MLFQNLICCEPFSLSNSHLFVAQLFAQLFVLILQLPAVDDSGNRTTRPLLTFGTDDHMGICVAPERSLLFSLGRIIHHLPSCINSDSAELDQNRQAFELQGCWTSIILIQLPPSYETLHSLSCECKSSWSPPVPLANAAATVGELLPLAWWNNMIDSTSGNSSSWQSTSACAGRPVQRRGAGLEMSGGHVLFFPQGTMFSARIGCHKFLLID